MGGSSLLDLFVVDLIHLFVQLPFPEIKKNKKMSKKKSPRFGGNPES